jgi:hypothetical protein
MAGAATHAAKLTDMADPGGQRHCPSSPVCPFHGTQAPFIAVLPLSWRPPSADIIPLRMLHIATQKPDPFFTIIH